MSNIPEDLGDAPKGRGRNKYKKIMGKKNHKNHNTYTEYILTPEITHPLLLDLLNNRPRANNDDGLDNGAGIVAANLLENYLVPASGAAVLFYGELCPTETEVQLEEETLRALTSAKKHLIKNKKKRLSNKEERYAKDAITAFSEAISKKYCDISTLLSSMGLAYELATNYTYSDRKMVQQTAARIIALFRSKNGWEITERFFLEMQKWYDMYSIIPELGKDNFKLFHEIENNVKDSKLL